MGKLFGEIISYVIVSLFLIIVLLALGSGVVALWKLFVLLAGGI